MMEILRIKIFSFILLFPYIVFATAPTWEIVPNESKLTFTGTQNNAPVSGEFKKFHGKLIGDINQLDSSSAILTIETASLSISFKDLEDTLKSADWFDIRKFPTAVFNTTSIKKLNEKTFQAKGTLTIRDKTLPLDATFILVDYTPTKAQIKGTVNLKRTVYDIGRGEWGSTDEVKDLVRVDFFLTAVKKQ